MKCSMLYLCWLLLRFSCISTNYHLFVVVLYNFVVLIRVCNPHFDEEINGHIILLG